MIYKFLQKCIRLLRGEVSTSKLIERGLKVGKNFNPQCGCIIDSAHCWLINIGDNVTLAPRVYILAHDASTKMHLGYTKIGRVNIGNKVFIGANTTILPNVSIGNNVIIGSGSIVSHDVPDNCVAAGNPAKVICTLDAYLNKNRILMEKRPVYNEQWTMRKGISDEMKDKMIQKLQDGIGYVD